jgi:hypothetical protein
LFARRGTDMGKIAVVLTVCETGVLEKGK